ncbi:uncharacterized protein L3040_005747 [Drepanopeziza brunnea f. sp. 'multigermtubi']|uniref:Uncharacterized protein n=1 Tax=Marssonina brunnea f. sp. multigermtubi (strain MB_m1) TaxID=1072389 RepID=K1X9K2_MARBU|nr:uncharacterized protein MBM_00874 [Drepanopeziza brunnea f. sp. 'multigermtubi' MB_m1]EKD21761.1 hypothetical protein MBM_00874 [Drepanopeziza brunnea f. sp. 'multigermtubi' MB_m1]KAJ5041196.1 hypothetical protein L3040_005747 [Drepanopeziza brunnea f. sp. 'multigermtubi']
MLGSTSFFAILLALSYFFNTAQGMWWKKKTSKVMGYATVSEADARRINQDNKLFPKEPTTGFDVQLGHGFYILQGPENWPNAEEGNWYCAITAKTKEMRDLSKVYIPSTYWSEDEEFILSYVRALVNKPDEALRISWVRAGAQLQMLIPSKVIAEDTALKLRAKCFETENQLKEYSDKFIDWQKKRGWTIHGELGRPSF